MTAERDVFISHAWEDKEEIARPLAVALRARDRSVWFDEYELMLGDSLRARIDDGLRDSRVGVVILSRSFFAKQWPRRELDGLVARQIAGESHVIVPVWHDIGVADVRAFSLPLAGLVAAKSTDGAASIADAICQLLDRLVDGAPTRSALPAGPAPDDLIPAGKRGASRGLEWLLGSVRLRVEGSDARFEVAGEHTKVPEVRPPGAVVGCGPTADVRVVGAAADGKISREHLLVAPAGRQWTIADCGSTNGTHEVDTEDEFWRAIPADVPVPVEDGMLVCLGPELVLRLELCVPSPVGAATPRLGGPGARAHRIRPAGLEQLAIALLQHRRGKPTDRSLPSVTSLARTLSVKPKAVKRGMNELRELAPVTSCLTGKRPEQLADALEIAFPYLVVMAPEAQSGISLADRGESPPPAPTA